MSLLVICGFKDLVAQVGVIPGLLYEKGRKQTW